MEFFQANIQFHEVLVQLLAFLIVFFTLKALAWKPILRGLDARRQRIQDELEKIETAKKEIESLKNQYSIQLQKIEDEARAKIQEAVSDGSRIAREIQDRARAESQAAFEKTKESLSLEVAKARMTLRQEIADLSIRVSEKIMKEKLNEAKQQEKILEMIEELEAGSSKGESR
jgi:F-type H+-transporting ATPase subunit b